MTNPDEPDILRCVPPTSPLYTFADHLLDGQLATKIAGWRSEGESWDWIARMIWAETDRKIEVSGPGVQKWARQLGIADPERAA